MIRLRQIKGADTGREFEFVLARVRIGRVPDSEVNFDPEEDLDASGRHAEIRRERGGYWILDTDSRNGTWLNGERVKRAQLQKGDELEFGRGGPRLVVSDLLERSMAPRAPTEPFFSVQAPQPSETDPFSVPVTVTTRLEHISAALAPRPQSSLVQLEQHRVALAGPEDDTLPPPPLNPGPVISTRRRNSWLWVAAGSAALIVALIMIVTASGSAPPAHEETPLSHGEAADRLRPAVRQVVGEAAEGARTTVCLAFAVMERLYATTASCVALVQRGQERGRRYVLQGASGEATEVTRMWRHPDFQPNLRSPDVGLLEVSERSDARVELATGAALGVLQSGDDVLLFDGVEPSVSAKISDVGRLDGDVSAGVGLLSHAAVASDGSPIVDANGIVVGIHVAAHGTLEGYGVSADRIEGLVRGLELSAPQAGVTP